MFSHFRLLHKNEYLDYINNNHCLVVFIKKGCPNCKVLTKVMEKCASSHPDMLIAGVDADETSDLLEELNISRVPTALVYRNGGISASKAGVMNPAEVVSLYYGAR